MNSFSFTNLLEAYGDRNPPEFLYDENTDIEKWRKNLSKALESLRVKLPERTAPEVKIFETAAEDTYSRRLVEIPVNEFSTLPAYILIPNDIKEGERRPGIFASHGHTKLGMKTISGVEGVNESYQAYGLNAVKSGFVVISPAWWGWPGRDGHVEKINEGRDQCNVIQFAAAMYGMNVLDLHVQDAEAAIDVLASLPEVDENNLGCIGNSYGGRTAMWISFFDKRIKAAVAAGSMNTLRERSLKLASCAVQFLPGTLKYCDVAELFCLMAPRALQLQVGKLDKLITPEDRDEIDRKVSSIYKKMGCSEKYDYVLHEGGHFMEWSAAETFLKEQLV